MVNGEWKRKELPFTLSRSPFAKPKRETLRVILESGHIDNLLVGLFAISMIAIAVIDFRKFIIPDVLVVLGGIIGMGMAVSYHELGTALASGGGAFLLLAATRSGSSLILGRESMGIGDLKLAGVIGLFTGFVPFLIALWTASILGTVYGFVKIRNPKSEIRDKSKIQNPKIPFGAFLALSSLVIFAFKGTILQILDSWLTLNP